VIGGILAAVGASKAKNAAPPMPAHTVDSVRADVAAAKGAMQ
jgi:membrane protein